MIGISILAITFFLGYLTVPSFRSEMKAFEVEVIDVQNETLQPKDVQTKKSEFVPEFIDLPSFEEFENVETKGKLIEILDDRIYRQSEVVAKSGEKWLVFEQDGDHRLKDSTASVKKLKSVSWPGDEQDARLTFSGGGNPMIAVKDIPGLKPGKINTLFYSSLGKEVSDNEHKEREMVDGFNREFKLNDTIFILRVSKGLTKDEVKVGVLVLESNGLKQVIKQTNQVISDEEYIVGSLLWAGDLDGDGKLDMYFDEFNEKGYTGTELHLSSLAKSGKLVKLAASFGMAGC